VEGFPEQFVKQMTQFSDRLGQPGNVHNRRFDKIVDEWKLSDGSRNPPLEFWSIVTIPPLAGPLE
jgi:hypothetical protein